MNLPYLVLASLLALGFLIGVAIRRAGLSPAVGYLLAGIILGYLASIPSDVLVVLRFLSELSILLLFFEIGFEIHVTKLSQIKGFPLYASLAEVGVAAPLSAGVSILLGFGLRESLILGLIASFSSTVFTYRLLEDHEAGEDVRKFVLMVAAVEDIFIVTALTLLRGGNGNFQLFILETGALTLAIYFTALKFSSRVLSKLITPDEGGLILTISYCLLLGVLTSFLGMSSALGAFIAGLTVSVIPQSGKIMTLFKPVRAVFLTLFFITMGLNISAIHMAPKSLALTILIATAIAGIHAFTAVTSSLLSSGLGLRNGLKAGLYLSTVSELSIVMAYYGVTYLGCSDMLMPASAVSVVVGALTGSYLVASRESIINGFTDFLGPERVYALDALTHKFRVFVESPIHSWVQDAFKTILRGVGEFLLTVLATYVFLTELYVRFGIQVLVPAAAFALPAASYVLLKLTNRMGEAVDRLIRSLGDSLTIEVEPVVKEALYVGVWIITLETSSFIATVKYMDVIQGIFGPYSKLAVLMMTAGPLIGGGALLTYSLMKHWRR